MEDFFRVAHFLAYHDHFEISGVVKQLESMQLKLPESLRLRISLYNLRKFCEPTFPLDNETVNVFYKKLEKLDKLHSGTWDSTTSWCEMRIMFFVQRAISVLFVKLGISQQERRNQNFRIGDIVPFIAESVVEYVKEVNVMFSNLVSRHPVFGDLIDSYQTALLSVTANLFGTGKRTKQTKLSKTRLVALITGSGDFNQFVVQVLAFLKSAETQVLPVPASIEVIEFFPDKVDIDLPEYVSYSNQNKIK